MCVCVCEYITIITTLTGPYCKLRSTRKIKLSATVTLPFSDNTHPDTMRERYNIYEMMQAFFDVQGNWIELM